METIIVTPSIEAYCEASTSGESALLKELAQVTQAQARYPVNLSGPLVGQTLKLLIQLMGAKTVLDVGMFTGYSALSMAEGLPENGRVYACETNPHAIEMAQSFFDRSPHGHKIIAMFGFAKETIPTIQEPLDLVFIDADKKQYPLYLDMVLPMLKVGGIVVLDDALWKGKVLDPQEDRDRVIAELNAWVRAQANLENLLLPVRHGINIIRKMAA